MILHSIRWRILAWNNALLALVVTVLLVAFHRHECENHLQLADVELHRTLVVTLPELHEVVPGFSHPGAPGRSRPPGPPPGPRGRPPPDDETREPRAAGLLKELGRGGVWCAVLDEKGSPAYRSANAPASLRAVIPDTKQVAGNDAETREITVTRNDQLMVVHRHPSGRFVIIGMPLALLEADFTRLAWMLAGIGFAIVGIGCTIGWIIAGRALRPIARISATAERIAAGDYASTIDVLETESELGRLAVVLNNTFAGLNAAREQLIRFTADASHELRTPLAVILASSRSALKRERSPDEYRETIESSERAARRMKSLSDDLLELARGGAGKDALQTFPCDLADLADETVAMLTPLAKQHGALITTDLASCPVNADPARLGRAIVNLVSNAILHNGAGVRIAVTTRISGDRAVLEILDTGKGIPAEHLDRIFDRFHRGDASRSRDTGGTGLGLAIVKQTVEAHGGAVTVQSAVGSGTVFTITMPSRKA